MQAMTVHLDLTKEGFELREGENPAHDAQHVFQDVEIGLMPRGTSSGKHTVMLKGRALSGKLVIMETTFELLRNAVDAMAIEVDG